jgi:hypothetical protein
MGIDDKLLASKTLDEKGQKDAAVRMNQKDSFIEEEEDNSEDEGTFNQNKFAASQNKESKKSEIPKDSGLNPGRLFLSRVLKWCEFPGILVTWGASLIWINIHAFLHPIFPKLFCPLGEEWLPPNLQSKKDSPTVQAIIKKVGLGEKGGLAVADLILLFVIIIILSIFVTAASFYTDNPLEKAKKIFQAITTLGFDEVKVIFDLFK